MICRMVRAICRLIANHCLIPRLRIFLFKISGIKIGKNVFINMGLVCVDNYLSNLIVIGDRVSIGPNVTFIPISSSNNSKLRIKKVGTIIVGDDTWIGTNVVIMPGVTIGKEVIIGANAVVTNDIPDYAIAVGIPARIIGDTRTKKFKNKKV